MEKRGFRSRPILIWLSIFATGLTPYSGTSTAFAEDIVYPSDANVLNVKTNFGAKGDGVTDDTTAIQNAINAGTGVGNLIYFPNGTYLVSKTLTIPLTANGKQLNGSAILQGESQAAAIIRLKNSTFTNASKPTPVLTSNRLGSADWFFNGTSNLTINTGTGNAGATGIQFFSNNIGWMRYVSIVSGDGKGVIGLDLGYNDMNGPLLISNVTVRGFQSGINCANSVNSQTFEHIKLSKQTKVGLANGSQALAIRDLESVNSVPAVTNGNSDGHVVLIDSSLTGGSSSNSAIVNNGVLFARNITTSGYAMAIQNKNGGTASAAGPSISEYVSNPTQMLFSSASTSLNLPISETPDVAWDPLTQWANVKSYGAKGDDVTDDTAAIQAAIDSGATTVYFPPAIYLVEGTIQIRGAARRLIAVGHARINGKPGTDGVVMEVVNGSGYAPTVVIQQLDAGFANDVQQLINISSRTMVAKDTMIGGTNTGSGNIYLEDTADNAGNTNDSTSFAGAGSVWARQFNQEDQGLHIQNTGSKLWILGLKTERAGTIIDTESHGQTEVLGGFGYTTTSDQNNAPMFKNDSNSAKVSIVFKEVNYGGWPGGWLNIVQETRGGATKTLLNSSCLQLDGGSDLPLYVGYPQ